MSRSFQNKPDSFCYICGELASFISAVRLAIRVKVWAPKICCGSCSRTLTGWLKGTHRSMPFAVQMVWLEPCSHLDHCYLCMTNITGLSVQSKHKTEYPDIPPALRPVSHDDSVPVPKPPEEYTLDSEPESEQASTEAGTSTREDQEFSAYSTTQLHLTTRAELNDIFRDLDLSKTKAQLFGSRLQQCKFHFIGRGRRTLQATFRWVVIFYTARHLWVDGRTSASTCS